MAELSLATPSIVFSAISLIMLAYTNRFLAYAQIIRNISEEYRREPSQRIINQIQNLKKRLYLTRAMQILGIVSLLFCVVSTFLIFVGVQTVAVWIFGLALLSLIVSLIVSVWELLISAKSLEIHLDDIK